MYRRHIMDDSLYDDVYNELNRLPEEPYSDSVEGILLDALDSEFEEVIIIGKSGDEYSLAFNYDDDLTALGMLRQAEHHILKMIDDD